MFRATTAALLLLAAGCGGSGKPVPVQGKLLVDGRPLARANVVFLAQEEGGRDAHGMTDAQGVFRLSTFEPADGALPGKYKVIIQYSEEVEVPAHLTTPDAVQDAIQAGTLRPKKAGIAIPPHYGQADRTELEQTVPVPKDLVISLTISGR